MGEGFAVRRLDTDDDQLLVRVHAVLRASHELATPADPADELHRTVGWMRHPPATEPRLHWHAMDPDSGETIGYAALMLSSQGHSGRIRLVVDPAHRRRGAGRALLEVVVEAVRAHGRTALVGSHADRAGAAFASAVGASAGLQTVRSVLRLPDAADVATIPAPRPAGYSVRSWSGVAPDDLLASYAVARQSIEDAPADDPGEIPAWTPAFVRDLEAALLRRGTQMRVTVALDDAGVVVGATELRVSPDPGSIARTEDTAVRAEHRGRGLATMIKLESLRLLRVQRPDVQLVSTDNDTTNAAMLVVNRRLGFAPTATRTTAVLELVGAREGGRLQERIR